MKIAIYVGPTNGGSVARISTYLANGFLKEGLEVDLLVRRTKENLIGDLAPGIRTLDLGSSNAAIQLAKLAWYLRRKRPQALITHRIRENTLCLRARGLVAGKTRIFSVIHGPMSVKLKNLRPSKRKRRLKDLQKYYPLNDGLIAISRATAEDTRDLLRLPPEKIWTIPNPAFDDTLFHLAQEPVDHPFFSQPGVKVILGVGRLEKEKDFPTLIKAFSILVSRDRSCRLLILGEGSLRPQLEGLIRELDLQGLIDMPGFVKNPYAYMKRAHLVALSSTWDALPTVLIEALALGTPVVSTSCGPGPEEILEQGRLGMLVPPKEAEALARAMEASLSSPPDREALRSGAMRYHASRVIPLYLRTLGLAER